MTEQRNQRGLHSHVSVRRGPSRWFVALGQPDLVHHDVASTRWPGPPLRIALLSDFHTIDPWNGPAHLAKVVARVNALPVDLVLLLGDYIAARPTPGRTVAAKHTAGVLARLSAPLGVHAVLGNHDWRDDDTARATDYRETGVLLALREAGLSVLVNGALELQHAGTPFWLVGYDSQMGHGHRHGNTPRHDPETAFAAVPKGAPALLMAHEPDCFATPEPRALLQLSGHTHGGQANLMGWRPFTPSRHGGRFAYGHIRENSHDLVVSGGIGYSHVPLRILQPPEVTLVTLRGQS